MRDAHDTFVMTHSLIALKLQRMPDGCINGCPHRHNPDNACSFPCVQVNVSVHLLEESVIRS